MFTLVFCLWSLAIAGPTPAVAQQPPPAAPPPDTAASAADTAPSRDSSAQEVALPHFDQSVNFAPSYQINQNDPRLGDLFPKSGNGSNLCWPSALAHRMVAFQRQKPEYSQADLAQAVRKFVELCRTDTHTDPRTEPDLERRRRAGTRQSEKLACIARYFHENGFKHPLAFAVGRTRVGEPTGAKNQDRAVRVSDLRENISKGRGVILHIGWLTLNPRTHAWEPDGSHSLNAYGFDYNEAWGEKQITLKVANPNRNYRQGSPYFDSVQVTKLERQPGMRYPSDAGLVLSGPGFRDPKRLAILDGIFVFSPDGGK